MPSRFGVVSTAIATRPDVSHAAFRLYAILTTCADRGGRRSVSLATLSEAFGATEPIVEGLLGQLERFGVLRREPVVNAIGDPPGYMIVLLDSQGENI